MSIFSDLMSGITGMRTDLGTLRAQRGELQRQREDLRALPVPRSELADVVCRWVDRRGKHYVAGLPLALDYFIRHPEELYQDKAGVAGGSELHVPLMSAMTRGGYADREKGLVYDVPIEAGLFYLLGEHVKKSIRQAIEKDMSYPELVGPPRAQRKAKLSELDAGIKKLDEQIEEIESALAAVKGA